MHCTLNIWNFLFFFILPTSVSRVPPVVTFKIAYSGLVVQYHHLLVKAVQVYSGIFSNMYMQKNYICVPLIWTVSSSCKQLTGLSFMLLIAELQKA